jgi:serine/threonine-protein kinase RsbW
VVFVLRSTTVCVETPGDISYRNVILRAVAAACKAAFAGVWGGEGPADEFTSRVLSVVGEAFNNIAFHCYRDRSSDIARVRVTIDATAVYLRIEDYGRSFDPLGARLPDLDALPESGLGIYIMRSLMDTVSYQAGWPNVLSLSKSILEGPGGPAELAGKKAANALLHE